jgi:SdrD B-like domain/Domain of unknown function DUF11
MQSPASRKKNTMPRRTKAAVMAAAVVGLPLAGALSLGFGDATAAPITITGHAYVDANGNGTFDALEGVNGVTATAYGSANQNLGGAATTSGDGAYAITTTDATYSPTGPVKVAFTTIPAGTPINGSKVVQFIPSGGATNIDLQLSNGATTPSIEIGDRVWRDDNGNGIQDAGEPGLAGVTVNLLEAPAPGGTFANVATATTDGNGYYRFAQTASAGATTYAAFGTAKSYRVEVAGVTSGPLKGMVNTATGMGTLDTDSNGSACGPLSGGPAVDTTCDPVSAPINPTAPTGTWDYSQDFGFKPYDYTITQTITTPASGANVAPGDSVQIKVTVTNNGPAAAGACQVTNLLPAGLTYASPAFTGPDFTAVAGSPTGQSLVLNCNAPYPSATSMMFTVNATVDAGATVGAIKNVAYVSAPAGDAVTSELIPLGTPLPTNATDTLASATNNDSEAALTIVAATTTTTAPTTTAGVTTTTPAATSTTAAPSTQQLCGLVWDDTNKNGVQDAGEASVPGVTVALIQDAPTNSPVATTTTTSTGYCFPVTGLHAYFVKFTPPAGAIISNPTTALNPDPTTGISDVGPGGININNVNAGLQFSAAATTTTTTPVVTTTPAATSTTTTTTVVPGAAASLGDRVWYDTNSDGQQDANEAGAPDVTVNLLSGGITLKTTITDASGTYRFDGLNPSTYKVEFVAPSNYGFTVSKAGADATDSDADVSTGQTADVVLASGDNISTIDAGLIEIASLGDHVFVDANANGIQDAGDTDLANVEVRLLDTAGNTVATTTTNASGVYSFKVKPGTYKVLFVAPNGYNYTTPLAGSDRTVDSDANTANGTSETVILAARDANTTIDAGFVPVAVAPTSSTATVATTSSTPPANTIIITAPPSTTTIAPATTTTLFSRVIIVPAPSTTNAPTTTASATTTTVASASSSTTPTTTKLVSATTNPTTTISATIPKPGATNCKLSSTVWLDSNANGVLDLGEKVLDNVKVRVSKGAEIIGEELTDATGRYTFTNLPCGDVVVELLSGLPAGIEIPAPKTFRVLGEQLDAVEAPFGVSTPADIAFGGSNTSPFIASALIALGLGGLIISRRRRQIN